VTLAYNAPLQIGKSFHAANYIVATANDTTATVHGLPFTNDGDITALAYVVAASDKTGTNPTLTVALMGSNDGTTYVPVVDSGGNAITTTALAISGSGSGTIVSEAENTTAEGISMIPFRFLRLTCTVGGTSTPGWTGIISLFAQRA
jgi:hypothetical protein